MSLPAREAERWQRPISPRRPAPPARRPAARPPISNPPHPHGRARRGPPLGYWAFSLAVVSFLTVGLVSLNAMRVDAAYRAREVEKGLRQMADERETLVNEVARLSSPSRIGRWARSNRLVHPEPGDLVILQVPGSPIAGPQMVRSTGVPPVDAGSTG